MPAHNAGHHHGHCYEFVEVDRFLTGSLPVDTSISSLVLRRSGIPLITGGFPTLIY